MKFGMILVLLAVLGAAHLTQSLEFDQYLESAEASEFDALGNEFVAPDCDDIPPPSAPDCRYKKTSPSAAACMDRDQMEAILKLMKEYTPKLEAALKANSKGALGAPAKDVKTAVDRHWSPQDSNAGDARNVHSGGRSRFRNRSPWRSDRE